MEAVIQTYISNIFVGSNKAYVYIWLSILDRFVYVGQTNDRYGTWGRGYAHVSESGTLRCRCEDRLGIYLDSVKDLTLFSYFLPSQPEFLSVESSYRLAVEYLVQTKLYEVRKDLNPTFSIVSNIISTDRTENVQVKQLADGIVSDFVERYSMLSM